MIRKAVAVTSSQHIKPGYLNEYVIQSIVIVCYCKTVNGITKAKAQT